jgi:hypothetical protein
MNALGTFLDQAWKDHPDQPSTVAARLTDAIPLAQDDDGVVRLAALAHHVTGEHLGWWQDGLVFLRALSESRVQGADAVAALGRCQASLRLCSAEADTRDAMSASDQCRVTSMAACNLTSYDVSRASALLEDAVVRGERLPDADPGVRTLAANSNGIAATLQEVASLSPPQRELMLRAAHVARAQWERAGTWREVERAEYRLAVCWLAAGDAKRAFQHAQLCDAIVRQNGSEPLEVFFAAEALGLQARALGDNADHAAALSMAQRAFQELPENDQAWCRVTLNKLAAS